MTAIASNTHFVTTSEALTTTTRYPPSTSVSKLAEDFSHMPTLESVAVVKDDRPIGLITRQKFLFTVFRRFGWEVFGRKSIVELTDTSALTVTVSERLRLDEALSLAVSRRSEDVYDELIVTNDQGCYVGLLSVRQMIVQHSHALANILTQKNIPDARAVELEKMSELKSHFLANVTHELRSPVNAIIGLAELVRMAADEGFVSQARDRLALLLSSATNLRSIITNILDLSKIEAGKMQVIAEEFDLVPLLEEISETTRVLVGLKPVRVVLESEAKLLLMTDPVKCRQIILNLTSNAAKFTDSGVIHIRQTSHGRDAVISVTDSGIGVRDEHRERLFEAFGQVEDSRSKRHEGTGLGLTITRELLDLLGGSIEFESTFGSGSTFTVHIPHLQGAAT